MLPPCPILLFHQDNVGNLVRIFAFPDKSCLYQIFHFLGHDDATLQPQLSLLLGDQFEGSVSDLVILEFEVKA